MTIKPKNILLVKNRALGDAIISIAAGNYLRSQFPDAHITFATPQWTAGVFEEISHPFDAVFPLKIHTIGDVLALWNELLNCKYDFIYEMHYGPRTGRILKLFSKLKGVPYHFYNHHTTERASIISRDILGISQAIESKFNDTGVVPNVKKGELRKIVLGVVATRETKMWPLQYFVDLVAMLKDFDKKYEILIPISKSVMDGKIKNDLLQLGLDSRVQFIEQPLDHVAKLFKGIDLYIGNDTGLKHLAAFSGVKTISFFGPEEPLEWHPYDHTDHPCFFLPKMPCRYESTAHYCGLSQCDSMECLKNFSPQDVIDLISR